MVQINHTVKDVEEELRQIEKLYKEHKDRNDALLERIKDLNFYIYNLTEKLNACQKKNR